MKFRHLFLVSNPKFFPTLRKGGSSPGMAACLPLSLLPASTTSRLASVLPIRLDSVTEYSVTSLAGPANRVSGLVQAFTTPPSKRLLFYSRPGMLPLDCSIPAPLWFILNNRLSRAPAQTIRASVSRFQRRPRMSPFRLFSRFPVPRSLTRATLRRAPCNTT